MKSDASAAKYASEFDTGFDYLQYDWSQQADGEQTGELEPRIGNSPEGTTVATPSTATQETQNEQSKASKAKQAKQSNTSTASRAKKRKQSKASKAKQAKQH